VSTTDQTVEPQLHALRAYAEARGLEIVEEYLDQGVSGAKDRRPGLDALLRDARRRRFDVLAVVKLDRLARSTRHLVNLAAELEAVGVDLVVLDQNIDTTTPAGRFLFNTLAAVAELERDLIRERTRAGMAAAKRRGARIGRPRAALSASELWRRHRIGESVAEMARGLGVARSTVRAALQAAGVAERVVASEPETAATAGAALPA
jgi:DNA invertase Pin-like site-specific DNA recombinase